jgi:peptidoglycan/LPS O-acetylase OafA/YrhL
MNAQSVATASQVLDENGGAGPGFDALRLLLSLWVFVLHCFLVCFGAEASAEFASNPFQRALITPALPMFFIVSGYLVTGSALRVRNTPLFLAFRVLRIAPALVFEVTLSAIVLGPLLTERRLIDYFRDALFAKYFLNILGNLHFFLPGMFASNPVSGIVNLNLWTLLPEYYCYLIISVLMFMRLIYSRRYLTLIGTVSLVAATAYVIRGKNLANFVGVVDWKFLVLSFVLGCLAYHWNHRIVVSRAGAAVALLVASLSFMHLSLILFALIAATYLVIYVGMRGPHLPTLLRNGDYSYGIYLFGFPVQQTIVYLLPPELRSGYFVLAIGLPFTLALAMCSWHLVERPTLSLKAKLKGSYR